MLNKQATRATIRDRAGKARSVLPLSRVPVATQPGVPRRHERLVLDFDDDDGPENERELLITAVSWLFNCVHNIAELKKL